MSENDFLTSLRHHQAIIYKLVHLYAQTEEDKKDFYQEIVLQAWKGYATFRNESSFGTWLYRISLNTIFSLQRRQRKIAFTDAGVQANMLVTTQNDDTERLYKAIRTLPDTERAIMSLHLDGYGNNEVAAIVGITANAVGVKLHRAKQQLANLLKDL